MVNLNKVCPLIKKHLGEEVIYHGQIMCRKKDGHLKDRIITNFYFYDYSEIESIYSGIKSMCDSLNARFYLNCNPKLKGSVNANMAIKITKDLVNGVNKPLSLLQSSIMSTNPHEIKYWVIDVDVDNMIEVNKIIDRLNVDFSYITTLKTVNGYHIITKPFNRKKIELDYDVKRNSFCLIYSPKIIHE